MGRGTHRLYTAWVPYGEVPLEVGGLMILEKSHLQAERIKNYLESDVDTSCTNIPGHDGWKHGGQLTNNPRSLRQKFGGRWLTSEFSPGDLLTFRMDTIHGSIDNTTQRIRLSTDTRYQRADEPVDERWVGENPIAHGPAGKRGLIC
jgi:ectoine hydroxylase-related dioxygenase (phytanoyl-CoA dioxygenase family)